jgi:hypothetical protein
MLMTHSIIIATPAVVGNDETVTIATTRPRDVLEQILESLSYRFVCSEIQIFLRVDVSECVGRRRFARAGNYFARLGFGNYRENSLSEGFSYLS